MRTPLLRLLGLLHPARLPGLVADWVHAGVRMAAAVLGRERPDETLAQRAGGDPACWAVPVVLVPGIWEPWRFLRPLASALHAAGHPVHSVATLGWNNADLDASAARVVEHLRRADVRGGVLVAHSKGGLIGKKVLLDADASERLVGMVAISTPFGGSSLSFGFLSRTPLGLFAPTGAAIAALTGERAVNARIVSLAPAWDQVIPEGSELPGARNIALDVAGHFRPVADAGVHRIVHDEIHGLAAAAAQKEGQ